MQFLYSFAQFFWVCFGRNTSRSSTLFGCHSSNLSLSKPEGNGDVALVSPRCQLRVQHLWLPLVDQRDKFCQMYRHHKGTDSHNYHYNYWKQYVTGGGPISGLEHLAITGLVNGVLDTAYIFSTAF